MCGRFALFEQLQLLIERFQLVEADELLWRSYNTAPSQNVLTVIKSGEKRRLAAMRWGLIPFWAKDPSIGDKLINARAETLAEKPSFKYPLQKQRCLIIASGFFEWRREGKRKIPLFIFLKDHRPFAFAGLYDVWKSPAGEKILSCTIVTTTPNEFIGQFHHRMPVILKPEDESLWLDQAVRDWSTLRQILKPFPAAEMSAYEVSSLVNSPANNSPECLAPRGNEAR
jgi:putative SOS response-associated peptidase YedK